MSHKCPQYPQDFKRYVHVCEDMPPWSSALVNEVWRRLLEGPDNPVVLRFGGLVILGFLENMDGAVRATIEVAKIQEAWESTGEDQMEIDYPPEGADEANDTGG